jgi:hypothetical protein
MYLVCVNLPVVQISTLQVPDDHLPEIGAPEAVALLESLLVDLLKGLEVILYALVVGGEMGHSRPVGRTSFGHGVVQEKRGEKDPVRAWDPEAGKQRARER